MFTEVSKLASAGSRSFGIDSEAAKRAVAFAFGPQHGWQRFAVFFLCADGALCALCPVAPFGAVLPASAAQSLAEAAAASDNLAHRPTTEAWIQQVRLCLEGLACLGRCPPQPLCISRTRAQCGHVSGQQVEKHE